MNIENLKKLKKGQKFKSYKALCEFLGEKVKSGDSKKKQMEEWNCYFKFKKQKNHSIVILEKYTIEEQNEKIIQLQKSKEKIGIYKEYIKKLVIDLLLKNKHNDYKVLFSPCQMFQTLRMVNYEYNYFKRNHHQLSEQLQIDKWSINDFYLHTYNNMKNAIDVALKSLAREKLVHAQYVLTVVRYDGTWNVATDEERQQIVEIERKVLQQFNTENNPRFNIGFIFANNQIDAYKSSVKKEMEIIDILQDVDFYYSAYDIVFSKDIKDKQQYLENMLIDNKNIQELQEELNNLIYENTINNSKNRREKVLNKYNDTIDIDIFGVDIIPVFKDNKVANNDYVKNTILLADTIIKINNLT